MKILVIIVLLILSINAHSQPPVQYGCLIGSQTSGTFYIDNIAGIYQLGGTQYRTSAPFCPRVQLGVRSGDCYTQLLFGTRHDRWTYTLVTTTSSPIACDIDHYAYGAVLLGSILVYRKLRGRNLKTINNRFSS